MRAGALRVVLLVLVSAIALTGCDDKRRHQTSEEVAFKVIEPAAGADASPEAIATEALAAMRDLQRVRAERWQWLRRAAAFQLEAGEEVLPEKALEKRALVDAAISLKP